MKKNNIKYIEINLINYKIYITSIRFKGSPDRVAKAYNSIDGECKDKTVVAGLKKPILSLCTLAVAFIHALEGKFKGSRVRNLSILFIMELYGFSQVNQVIDNIKEVDYIVVASLDLGCLEKGLMRLFEMGVKGENLELAQCRANELSKMVSRSIKYGVRLE